MRRLVALGAAICALAAGSSNPQSAAAQSRAREGKPALDEIHGEHIAAHLKFLSHDLLEGRAPSTRGGTLAAEYLAAQLAALGLEPGGDKGTYFQDVPIVESVVDPSFTLDVAGGQRFK